MNDRRILIKGGYVVSMDQKTGNLEAGEVLIERGKIAAMGSHLDAGDAEIVDATGMIVMPGMVDTHRHTWQTCLRALCADMSLAQYMRCVRFTLSAIYTPEDVYVGNYIGALEAINAGVTTLFDYSHTSHSPEHADEAIRGLLDAGVRGVYGYGYYAAPLARPHFQNLDERIRDAVRIRQRYFASDDQMLRMGIAMTEVGVVPFSETRREIESARELGVLQTLHTNAYWGSAFCTGVREMDLQNYLGPDQIHVHCNTSTSDELRIFADAGVKISCTPDTELQMGMGHSMMRRARDAGMRPTLGTDVISCNGGDILTAMRLGIQDARVTSNDELNRRNEMPEVLPVMVDEVLEWATINGAEAMGLGSQVGSLAVGKEADIVLIAQNDFNMIPLANKSGSVIMQANVSNIDTVFIQGKLVKRDGKLVGVDIRGIQAMAEASHDRIMRSALARGPLLPPADKTLMAVMEQTATANLKL